MLWLGKWVFSNMPVGGLRNMPFLKKMGNGRLPASHLAMAAKRHSISATIPPYVRHGSLNVPPMVNFGFHAIR